MKVGWRCNHNCIHCVVNIKSEISSRTDFSLEEIKSTIDRYANYDKITLTGGEPFLRRDIIDILSYIKKVNPQFQVEVQTNGTLLKDESLVREASKYVDLFFVALHSYRKSTHDLICDRTGSWDDTTTGLVNLINNNCNVATQTVISKFNISELEATFDFFYDIKLYNNWLTFPHPNGNAYSYFALVVPKYSEIEGIVKNILTCHPNVRTSAIPPCYLPEFGEYRSDELHINIQDGQKNIRCVELVNKNKDYEPDADFISMIQGEFNKNANCATCIYNDECVGVWKEYLEQYDDLRPVVAK